MRDIRGQSDIIGPNCFIKRSTVSYQHPLRPNGTFWPPAKHKEPGYTQNTDSNCKTSVCVQKDPLTHAEVHCCMSRAPASASGPGEPLSDEAGRSSWGAAADSSASQTHWSTPLSDAHMTSACRSTGCSTETKCRIRDRWTQECRKVVLKGWWSMKATSTIKS